eukprot:9205722-Alexandrium_andersonii.AAC.1
MSVCLCACAPVRLCVCTCMRACTRACVVACVRACARVAAAVRTTPLAASTITVAHLAAPVAQCCLPLAMAAQ